MSARPRGRPKGSKDGPRPEGAPPRGRPRKNNIAAEHDADDENSDTEATNTNGNRAVDTEDGFDASTNAFDAFTAGFTEDDWRGVDQASVNTGQPPIAPTDTGPSLEQLREARKRTHSAPFFTRGHTFSNECDSESEDDGNSEEESSDSLKVSEGNSSEKDASKAWFDKPKYMPVWLYDYFRVNIQPMIFRMEGRKRARPPSIYIQHFPLAAVAMDSPDRPYFPARSCCFPPHGTLPPSRVLVASAFFRRKALLRITDLEDSFYIISWAYYCRKGCKSYFCGWSRKLLDSLPPFLRLAFPAVLSRKGGISHSVLSILRVGNQHKMGPSGVRSLLCENHTLRFSTLQAQYLEAIFAHTHERAQKHQPNDQTSITDYVTDQIPNFGDFGDYTGFSGFVPSERYLSTMLNRAIEADEADADQHTSCLEPDQLAVDDSHKINKHIAKIEGVPVFNALWTCMTSRYIRAQVLTLTKSHEERYGPLKAVAKSIRKYGFQDPSVVFSDDPVKDKPLLLAAFPSLATDLTPVAAAHGLDPLELPVSTSVQFLGTYALVESALSSLTSIIDASPNAHLCISIDAEWNISRRSGVSILQLAPHSDPESIFIIPVHKFDHLPPSLLRLLVSNRVFKIGSSIKADFTRLKKQFPQLKDLTSFNVIDLKAYSVERGVIRRKKPGSLDVLAEKVLKVYLSKDDSLRKNDEWETLPLPSHLMCYAALDVHVSLRIFAEVTKLAPLDWVRHDSPAGSRVALLVHEGGEIAAYGKIAATQPSVVSGVRVKTQTNSRVVIDVDQVLIPTAAAILHLLPSENPTARRRTGPKAGAYTLQQLQAAASGSVFQIVCPVALLNFDRAGVCPSQDGSQIPSISTRDPLELCPTATLTPDSGETSGSESESDDEYVLTRVTPDASTDGRQENLQMHEAHTQVNPRQNRGEKRDHSTMESEAFVTHSLGDDLLSILRKLVDAPEDTERIYTRILKDIFHAFHMIPISVNHGLRAAFLHALRDHIMRWDPSARGRVDKVCREVYGLTFDQMLARNPDYIKRRTPRHVPSPNVLVPMIQHIFNTFGNALDAKTQQPLFSPTAWQKANAVLELLREGYLSDLPGVAMYEHAGVDKHGLNLYKCLRGTNNVEGGPHGDIYRKFGALHAGPRLTVNSLTDHRTWYNLQAFAKHVFRANWDYHHSLSLINRTSFLLNYLSDIVEGASSYSHWINGDLYARTEEKFGIAPVPESLRVRLAMQPYSETAAATYKLGKNDDWLRRKQGLALPALPPTTLAARKYFFTRVKYYSAQASTSGKGKIDMDDFAQEWNRTADGEDRFYITTELLAAYAKTWQKNSNIRASQELIADKISLVSQTRDIFLAPSLPFPSFIVGGAAASIPPSMGVVEMFDDVPGLSVDLSISTGLPASQLLLSPVKSHQETLNSFIQKDILPLPSSSTTDYAMTTETDFTDLSTPLPDPSAQSVIPELNAPAQLDLGDSDSHHANTYAPVFS
ncbi:hypothetical protein R3P38DRAFT_3234489 [Favolaschia claudopus]|uniref:3'-5' exonuclease domain-containing protein n=1 Tax=Favolaschia claudopus TaxID=2862362 RepID=A0AAV9ZG85_9AGAR